MTFENPSPDELRALFEGSRRIAIVGLSDKAWRSSHQIGVYLLEQGFEIVPVYPRHEEILGRKVYRNVAEIPEQVDIVDVFRRSEFLPGVVEDALSARLRPAAVWFQLGCVHEEAAARAQRGGLKVVMDRCIAVEHGRLLGA
jgi:hypothetical protein